MALPPRGAAVFVKLTNNTADPFVGRTTGSLFPVQSYVQTGDPAQNDPKAPGQPAFWGSQVWFANYPEDAVAKVHLGLIGSLGNSDWITSYEYYSDGSGNTLYMDGFTGNVEVITTFPNNIVGSYDPTPAPGPADPVPNPNGGTGNTTTTYTETWGGGAALPAISFLPRWHTDTAYDISTIGTLSSVTNGYCPKFNSTYTLTPGTSLGKCFSIDVTVTNYQSQVLNLQTSAYEYYNFTQTTFDYRQTAKVKLKLAQLCGTTSCWDNGTVITGTVTFQGLDLTTEARGNPANTIYGFGGMFVDTGSTVTAAGSQSFTVTVSSSYVPIEITIPAVSNKITFINDFRIDSITRPS